MLKEECQLEYVPCFFEFKTKRWSTPIVIWMLLGVVCVLAFLLTINALHETVDLFTALYFVGGIGWIPAVLCMLSHAFYKMSVVTYPFFTGTDTSKQEIYSKAARLIFGYVKERQNRIISILIWIFMVATVLSLGPTFDSTNNIANVFIYFVYIAVGFVFSIVICAIVNFILYLAQLQNQIPIARSFHIGIVERLRANQTYCIWLNWGTVILFGLLAIAMIRSPYGQKLWWWLPVLGFFPLGLFISSNRTTTVLIKKSLRFEEETLSKRIAKIMKSTLQISECITLKALIDVQSTLRKYAESSRPTAEWFLFFFTLMSAFGSVIGAIDTVVPENFWGQLFPR